MNSIIKGALALSLLTSMSMAENNNIYVGVGLVMETIDNDAVDDTGTAIEVKVGKNIDNDFAIEGRFSKTIVEAEDDGSYYDTVTGQRLLLKADMMTYSLWGVYNYALTNDFIVSPRIGFLQETVSLSLPSGYNKASDIDESGIAFGVDIKKNIPSLNADIYVGYTLVESDVTHLSFGLLKNF